MAATKIPPVPVMRAIDAMRCRLRQLNRRTVPATVAVMEMVMDAWVAQAITAAADLGIADALATGPLSIAELAAATDTDAAALARLLRALSSRGIFRQRRDGRYELTPLAQPLRRDADTSLASWVRWAGSPRNRGHWDYLSDSVRSGRSVANERRGEPLFDSLARDTELQEIFNDAMTDVSELSIAPLVAAYDFSRFGMFVDVGGGHGRLLAAILNAAPGARGVLFDQPHVVAEAPDELRRHGVLASVRKNYPILLALSI